ncbi:UDP-rhamnose/UDP-galactose transporter 2-like [Rosa chinensis]|uniref:UDP-rhamnose/UDP-galactose transporter 2-like n=1 Tax=Rosa chinensis TaxID=74649 RepID=UPI001AD8D3C0|nr:UDP-rhamnose/UDP-galactose transporter 2-like [Rosa chinensis]
MAMEAMREREREREQWWWDVWSRLLTVDERAVVTKTAGGDRWISVSFANEPEYFWLDVIITTLQDDVWCICIHNALLLPSSILQHQSVPLHGRFSAVSFQVLFILGHMKTICVLTLGWLLFDSALTFKNLMGMALAVGGIIVYSWVGG